MIFKKIRLRNFGPFLGEQEIDISSDKERNVTFIHAQNYVGKTSILRAVIWCLYGTIIHGDDGSEVEILNDQARDDCDYLVEVAIDFEHEGKNYKFERKVEYEMLPSSKKREIPSFVGFEVDRYGHHTSEGLLNDPAKVINFFAPQELSKFFFLKGENSPLNENQLDLRDSIKEILGFNVLDQANADLTYLANSYSRSAAKFVKTEEVKDLKEAIEGYHQLNEKNNDIVSSCNKNIEAAEEEIKALEDQISDWQKIQGEKKVLKQLTEQINKTKNARTRLLEKKARWFRHNLFSLLSKKLCESGIEKINAEIHKGKIPSKYQVSFINELLDDQECICTTKLLEGSPERDAVESRLREGGDSRVYEAVIEAKTVLRQMSERRENLLTQIEEIEAEIEQCNKSIEDNEDYYQETQKRVNSANDKEMQKKSIQLNTARSMKTSELRKRDSAKSQLKTILIKLKEDSAKYDKMVSKNKEAKEKIEISNFVKSLLKRVNSYVNEMQVEARKEIAQEMNEIVSKSISEPPKVEVDSSFFYKVDKYVSGGPKRVLDFAYTASILSFNNKNHKILKKTGVIIPLVVDSAFGETDEEYRKALADFLPRLSPQLIVLVSGAQGYMFADSLTDRIGSEYILIREVKNSFEGEGRGIINVRGERIQTKFFEKEKDQTLIKRLSEYV